MKFENESRFKKVFATEPYGGRSSSDIQVGIWYYDEKHDPNQPVGSVRFEFNGSWADSKSTQISRADALKMANALAEGLGFSLVKKSDSKEEAAPFNNEAAREASRTAFAAVTMAYGSVYQGKVLDVWSGAGVTLDNVLNQMKTRATEEEVAILVPVAVLKPVSKEREILR